MSNTATDVMPDLWPESIRTELLTPQAILRIQAAKLKERTQGLLEGDVIVSWLEKDADFPGEPAQAQLLRFEVCAPALYYRQLILEVIHKRDHGYPVKVQSGYARGIEKWASNQEAFLKVLREVLQAPEIVSLLESLIARVNEESPDSEAAAP